jgi:hypothetical protein
LSFRSEPVAVPIAVAFAFLVVIPEGDLWLHLPVFLLSFRSAAEESASSFAFARVIRRNESTQTRKNDAPQPPQIFSQAACNHFYQ